jgi:hypothetical protein
MMAQHELTMSEDLATVSSLFQPMHELACCSTYAKQDGT